MEIRFALVSLDDVREDIGARIRVLPGIIDSFLEEHIITSQHARVVINGQHAGLVAIHNGSHITWFSLDRAYLRYGEAAFHALRRQEQVTSALVPTCDECFLVHALDDYRRLVPQARLFHLESGTLPMGSPEEYVLRQAERDDARLLDQASELFGNIELRIAAGELFVPELAGDAVGFGIREMSHFVPHRASIGMFVPESGRRRGVGTAIVASLIRRCHDEGIDPVAGCWYYNHRSRRTLERAGLVSSTRLLRIEF